MSFKKILTLLLGLLFILSSCNKKTEVKEVDSAEIIEQVKNQVDAFHEADITLNSEGVIDLLWPEFTMLVDGNYVTYDDIRKNSPKFMASLESFHTEWKNLRIVPIGNQHAISSFIFTDSIVAKDGAITQSKGPNTFVWEKRNGNWKVIYGDADHYPIE